MNRAKPFLYTFLLFAVLNVIAEALGSEVLRLYTKPFLMPLLGVWFAQNTFYHTGKWRSYILVAIVFSLIGDCILLATETSLIGGDDFLFICGLLAFAVSHIFYGSFFGAQRYQPGEGKSQVGINQFLILIAYLLTAIVVLPLLREHQQIDWSTTEMLAMLGVMLTYALIILGVAYAIVRLREHLPAEQHKWLQIGIGLYLFSDALIAVGVLDLIEAKRLLRPVIMATYIAAQFLLVRGAGEIILKKVATTDEPTPQNVPSDRPL